MGLHNRTPSRPTFCTTGSVKPRGKLSWAALNVRVDSRMIYYLVLNPYVQNPFKARGFLAEKDSRSEEEQAKHMDRKTPTERARLLKEVFETVEVGLYVLMIYL